MPDNDYKSLIEFFDIANEKLKYPKFVAHLNPDSPIRLQRAGSGSRHTGTLNITDNKAYGENIWYGRIHRDGTFERSRNRPYPLGEGIWQQTLRDINELLQQFAADPPAFAAIQGKRFNFCCFCNSELSNPGSIHWGYGPICAGNYGLPWTDKEPEDAITERVNSELEDAIKMQGLNFGKPKALPNGPIAVVAKSDSELTPSDNVVAKSPIEGLSFVTIPETPKVPTGAEVNAHILEAQKESHESFSVNFRETIESAYNDPALRRALNALILREWETPDTLVDAIHDVTLQHVLQELEAIEQD